jgi:biopolymer transport protein ExbD
MLPLIDIVFLLLVFFIYAMLSMAVHRSLPVDLPASASAAVDPSSDISLTVTSDGAIFVDKEAVSLERLPGYLRLRVAASGKKGVLVFADRDLSYQSLFRVLDRIRQAGIENVSLQAEKDG